MQLFVYVIAYIKQRGLKPRGTIGTWGYGRRANDLVEDMTGMIRELQSWYRSQRSLETKMTPSMCLEVDQEPDS